MSRVPTGTSHLLDSPQDLRQTLRQRDATTHDADQSEIVSAVVLLDDLVGEPNNGAIDFRGGHDLRLSRADREKDLRVWACPTDDTKWVRAGATREHWRVMEDTRERDGSSVTPLRRRRRAPGHSLSKRKKSAPLNFSKRALPFTMKRNSSRSAIGRDRRWGEIRSRQYVPGKTDPQPRARLSEPRCR